MIKYIYSDETQEKLDYWTGELKRREAELLSNGDEEVESACKKEAMANRERGFDVRSASTSAIVSSIKMRYFVEDPERKAICSVILKIQERSIPERIEVAYLKQQIDDDFLTKRSELWTRNN